MQYPVTLTGLLVFKSSHHVAAAGLVDPAIELNTDI